MLKLKENSITARLYRWFYAKTSMPTNLCPYFWKVVIMYTFILPYTLFCLPVIVVKPFQKFRETIDTNRVLSSIIIYVALFFLSCMLYLVSVFCGVKYYKDFAIFGIIGWVTLFALAIFILIIYLKEKYQDYKYEKEANRVVNAPKIFLIKEFISAKYHKYCPQITWKDNENSNN